MLYTDKILPYYRAWGHNPRIDLEARIRLLPPLDSDSPLEVGRLARDGKTVRLGMFSTIDSMTASAKHSEHQDLMETSPSFETIPHLSSISTQLCPDIPDAPGRLQRRIIQNILSRDEIPRSGKAKQEHSARVSTDDKALRMVKITRGKSV